MFGFIQQLLCHVKLFLDCSLETIQSIIDVFADVSMAEVMVNAELIFLRDSICFENEKKNLRRD